MAFPFTYFCPKHSNETYFANDYGTINSSTLYYRLAFCNKAMREDCKFTSYEESFGGKNLVVITEIQSSAVNSLSYENPTTKTNIMNLKAVNEGSAKILYLQITKDIYISNDGWMLENKREIEYFTLQDKFFDPTNPSTSGINFFYTVIMSSPRLREKYVRSYMKVQELFAKVGGIANACFIIINVLTVHYIRFNYLFFVKGNSLDTITEQKENSLNKLDREEIRNEEKIENNNIKKCH